MPNWTTKLSRIKKAPKTLGNLGKIRPAQTTTPATALEIIPLEEDTLVKAIQPEKKKLIAMKIQTADDLKILFKELSDGHIVIADITEFSDDDEVYAEAVRKLKLLANNAGGNILRITNPETQFLLIPSEIQIEKRT